MTKLHKEPRLTLTEAAHWFDITQPVESGRTPEECMRARARAGWFRIGADGLIAMTDLEAWQRWWKKATTFPGTSDTPPFAQGASA